MNRQGKVRFQLPAAEDDLWHQVIIRLLEQRDVDEEQAKNRLRLLEELAFHNRFCGKPLTRAFAEDTATWLAKEKDFGSPRDKAQGWLHDVERWELLLRRGNGHDAATYEFPIPGLDEYFAAHHLAMRWVEGDERYRTWLPYTEDWRKRGGGLPCPNPHCHATLPPFRDLFHQREYEETLLLMVGLLKEAEREEVFLIDAIGNLNLTLKALSRCRHLHWSKIQNSVYLRERWWDLESGLAALGRARVPANLSPLLRHCVRIWKYESWRDMRAWRSAYSLLSCIGEVASQALMMWLMGESPRVRQDFASVLIKIRDGWAIEALIALLEDPASHVRETAAFVLGQIGNAAAVPALRKLVDNDNDVFLRNTARCALAQIERRIRSESG